MKPVEPYSLQLIMKAKHYGMPEEGFTFLGGSLNCLTLVGDEVQIHTYHDVIKTKIAKIKIYGKEIEKGLCGLSCGLYFKDINLNLPPSLKMQEAKGVYVFMEFIPCLPGQKNSG